MSGGQGCAGMAVFWGVVFISICTRRTGLAKPAYNYFGLCRSDGLFYIGVPVKKIHFHGLLSNQPVWVCNELYWDSGEVNNRNFFTTNTMAISLTTLDIPFCFHMIPVCLGTSRINLLSSSACPPVWVIYHCF